MIQDISQNSHIFIHFSGLWYSLPDGIIIASFNKKAINFFAETKIMEKVNVYEMIITCESCGNVKRYRVHTQDDCDRLFKNFQCENNCGRNLLSFITVGSLDREELIVPDLNFQYAIAK